MKKRSDLSAGGVVYRRAGSTPTTRIEYLVGEQLDWRTGTSNVRLPKGHLEAEESLEQAALREVAEETGRLARIVEELGEHAYSYEVQKKKGPVRIDKRVVFYLMEDTGAADAPRDDEMADLHWLEADAACARLTFENEREMIRRAAARVEPS